MKSFPHEINLLYGMTELGGRTIFRRCKTPLLCLLERDLCKFSFIQVIADMMRISNHSNGDVHMACLKCFAAILSSHAPLTEVEAWLSSSDGNTEQSRSCKITAELTNQMAVDKTPTRPWVVSHCLKQFGNNGN